MSMHARFAALALAAVVSAMSAGVAAQKAEHVPVDVETTPIPKGLKAGDETTTTITFRARADLQRLDVNVAPFSGVQVLSEPTEAAFTDVKRGDAPRFTVTVRVTDSRVASLALHYETVSDGTSAFASVTIEFANRQ